MHPSAILQNQAYRQTALPADKWIMYQSWRELLFAHWPLAASTLRPFVPPSLTLDTFEGEAWIGIVPFRMDDVALRGFPPFPGLSSSPELNVRTYVTVQDVPGVYFFSLDAANPLFVAIARACFFLPYFSARMSIVRQDQVIHFTSVRTRRGPEALYEARYRPIAPVHYAAPGSLPFWLTERYCLYTLDQHDQVYRVDIHHGPLPLQKAEWEITRNTMARSHGIVLPDTAPVLHYAHRQDTLAWFPRRVEC